VFFLKKKAQERNWRSRTHYHICIAYDIELPI